MQIASESVILVAPVVLVLFTCSTVNGLSAATSAGDNVSPAEASGQPQNSIEVDNLAELTAGGSHKHVACGTIASNLTRILVKNPHHPKPTYVKTICETVVERSDQTVKRLSIRFRHFELYRPTYEGTCLHDRFAVYNDLNVAVTPIMCGIQTGQNLSIPFVPPQTSLIISVATSDLDHDRYWWLEIEQERVGTASE